MIILQDFHYCQDLYYLLILLPLNLSFVYLHILILIEIDSIKDTHSYLIDYYYIIAIPPLHYYYLTMYKINETFSNSMPTQILP
jgi:hypothetical protein